MLKFMEIKDELDALFGVKPMPLTKKTPEPNVITDPLWFKAKRNEKLIKEAKKWKERKRERIL